MKTVKKDTKKVKNTKDSKEEIQYGLSKEKLMRLKEEYKSGKLKFDSKEIAKELIKDLKHNSDF